MAAGTAAGQAVRRLRRELENLRRSQVPQIAVQPSEDSLLEWHFVLHSFGPETPYHGGRYHGKIIFPPEYPLAPPAILMVTPSGRLETGKRLCLSMTDFHPESWNPAWSVETILVGLLSFFVSDKESGYGAITANAARRKQLAADSHAANMRDAEFRALFPEFAEGEVTVEAAPAGSAPEQATHTEVPAPAAAAQEKAQAPPDKAVPIPGLVATADGNAAAAEAAGAAAAAERAAPARTAVDGGSAEEGLRGDAAEHPVADAEEDTEEPNECWICRDTTDEPLIQPCACRGSMSGVHASCVEDWISHHRRNAVNDEPPRCPACNQFYRGQELQPGVADFIRQKCYQGARQLLRTVALVFLVCGYQAAAEGKAFGLPVAARVTLIVLFSIAALHKVVVLTVSLPLHRPPPQDPCLRRFFVADYRRLSKHIAEASATIMILVFGCLTRTLPIVYFLPFALLSVIPIAKICLRHGPSMDCLVGWVRVLFIVLCAPFICVGYPLVWGVRYPRRAVKRLWQSLNPLGPGPQIYIAIAEIVLCLACQSNLAPVLVWLVHSAFLATGLLELFLVRKLPWHRSRTSAVTWLLSLQLAALAAYFANALCIFPQGWGAPDQTLDYVHGASCLWFLLVSALTVKVNWAFIVERYRVWQRRHGTFTLQVPGDGRAPLHRGEGVNAGPVAAADAPPPV